MENNNLDLIKKDLDEIKIEISFIKKWILDDEAGLEVSDEVINEVEESRKRKDFIPHEEVFKKYCNE
jgi:hypothetical protein